MAVNKTRDSFSDGERKRIAAAREKAFILYEGRRVPHRSCGIALAETFNLPAQPFQALRRGGITGEGECGAIKAGELVLGQYLGDPDPTGAVSPELRSAARLYREEWARRIALGPSVESVSGAPGAADIVCNRLTAPFEDFQGAGRQAFCTSIAATVAEIVAELLVRHGVEFTIEPIADLDRG